MSVFKLIKMSQWVNAIIAIVLSVTISIFYNSIIKKYLTGNSNKCSQKFKNKNLKNVNIQNF